MKRRTRSSWLKALPGILLAIPLLGFAQDDPAPTPPRAVMSTSLGEIHIQLDPQRSPLTVANFVEYADAGFYDGTIFHRVIAEFMIQGGGFTVEMTKKKTREPIGNEANNGLSNRRGTIAMARLPTPHSANAQFFINVRDNERLDYQDADNWGYAVFGEVVSGMEVVDQIRVTPTHTLDGRRNVPVEPVIIESVRILRE